MEILPITPTSAFEGLTVFPESSLITSTHFLSRLLSQQHLPQFTSVLPASKIHKQLIRTCQQSHAWCYLFFFGIIVERRLPALAFTLFLFRIVNRLLAASPTLCFLLQNHKMLSASPSLILSTSFSSELRGRPVVDHHYFNCLLGETF